MKGEIAQTTGVDWDSEGASKSLRMLRDGTVSMTNWIAALSLEGRVFTANNGVATTSIEFGAGGLDTTEFDFHIAVPAGVAIIPLELNIHYSAFGTALLVENVMQTGTGSVTGAGTTSVVRSSNPNSGRTSSCTCTGAAVAGTAFTANVKEIWREIDQLSITIATIAQLRVPYNYRWSALQSGCLDVVGPSAQLAVWASSNAGGGMISFKWAELPSAALV